MWYYQHGENRIGPVSEEMIRNLLLSQILNINSLVWKEGMTNWVPVHQTQLANGLPLPPPPLPNTKMTNSIPKDRIAYVLLAVFLGSLGIHNFFAGYKKNAVIQLVITLVSCGFAALPIWIWAIVEACTVTKDADGVDFK
jgi:TM2 domain-containing membrane protein YozV